MKKIFIFGTLLMLCLMFSSCEIMESPIKETVSSQASSHKSEEIFGINETAVFSNLKITATEIKETSSKDFFVPEDGNVFVGVKFTIENISDEEQAVSTLLLFEGYVDDVKCEYSLSASCAFDEGTLDGSIAPGKKLVGWYALEVPKNWENIELNVQPSWLSNSSAKFVFKNN